LHELSAADSSVEVVKYDKHTLCFRVVNSDDTNDLRRIEWHNVLSWAGSLRGCNANVIVVDVASVTSGGGNWHFREMVLQVIKPLCESHGVDIYITGHRLWPTTPEAARVLFDSIAVPPMVIATHNNT
jgi:hypothetical protein